MMKLYANLFALTEESISEKSIKRLRLLTIGSLPFLPITALVFLFGFPKGLLGIPVLIIFAVSILLTLIVLLTRIVNRVWAPEKYLDEWEKDLKRRSMSMSFVAVMYTAIFLFGIWSWLMISDISLPERSIKVIPYLMLMSVMWVGIYTQIFMQLSLIDPIDEDELEGPKYVVTTARSILGILALAITVPLLIAMAAGFYAGHRDANIEHDAVKEVCGDVGVDHHTHTDNALEVVCEGSDEVIRLDPETLKPI